MIQGQLRKGQYVLPRFRGTNGDVIVGQIESVRSNGTIVLKNLVNGRHSIKDENILRLRNTIAPKRDAMVVLSVAQEQGKKAAREYAVRLSSEKQVTDQVADLEFAATQHGYVAPMEVEMVVQKFRALSSDAQQQVARILWKEVLAVFGVQ